MFHSRKPHIKCWVLPGDGAGEAEGAPGPGGEERPGVGDARQGVWAGVREPGLWVRPEPSLLRLQAAAAWGAGLRPLLSSSPQSLSWRKDERERRSILSFHGPLFPGLVANTIAMLWRSFGSRIFPRKLQSLFFRRPWGGSDRILGRGPLETWASRLLDMELLVAIQANFFVLIVREDFILSYF